MRRIAQRYCGHNDIRELEARMRNIQVDTKKALKNEKRKSRKSRVGVVSKEDPRLNLDP